MPGSLEPKGECQIPFYNARLDVWSLPVPAATQRETDADCDVGFACNLPSAFTCDQVFNCPDEAASSRLRSRKLPFDCIDDDARTVEPDFGVSSASFGACMPVD